jgi:hypothetical protein
MPRRKHGLLIALALTAASMPSRACAQQAMPADSLERVRAAARFFYAGESDSLIVRMTPATLAAIGGKAGLMEGIANVGLRAGDEVSVVEERWNLRNGQRQYWRTSRMSTFPGDFLLRFNLDAAGNITGIGMGPAANAPPIESEGPVIPKP